MSDVVRQLAGRFLRGFGIADRPVRECVERIGQPYNHDEAPLRVVEATSDVAIALKYLSTLSWPASRHIAFAVGENTAFINNSRNGSDYSDHVVWLARYLNSRFARIVNQDGYTWTNGVDREVMRYSAVVFDLRNPTENRCVASAAQTTAADGISENLGHVFQLNAISHTTRRESETDSQQRNSTNWRRRLNIPTVGPDELLSAERFYLIHSRYPASNACTVSEADDPAYGYYIRGLTWVPRIETHASSIIADFERCLRLNSSYESKVRDSLNRAYKIINSQSDA